MEATDAALGDQMTIQFMLVATLYFMVARRDAGRLDDGLLDRLHDAGCALSAAGEPDADPARQHRQMCGGLVDAIAGLRETAALASQAGREGLAALLLLQASNLAEVMPDA